MGQVAEYIGVNIIPNKMGCPKLMWTCEHVKWLLERIWEVASLGEATLGNYKILVNIQYQYQWIYHTYCENI